MSKFGIAGQNTNSLAYADNRLASVPCVEGNKEPTIYDRAFPLWTEWRITQNPLTGIEGDFWKLIDFVNGDAIWVKLAGSGSGGILTLSDTANTLVYPTVGGNVQLEGTAGQIDVTSDPINNKLTFSLPGGGGAVDSFAVPHGTTPVVPDVNGLITITEGPGIVITGGLNTYSIDLNGAVVGQTITGNSGGALSPTAGNWNIVGIGETVTSGAGSTLSILEPRNNSIIVDPTQYYGTHQTIAAAIAAASADDIIFIRPGVYIENLTLTKNITFFAYGGKNRSPGEFTVNIIGKLTMSTASVICSFNNIYMSSNGNNIAALSADGIQLTFNGCLIECLAQTAFSMTGSLGNIYLYSCSITSSSGGTLFTSSNSSTMWIDTCLAIDIDNGVAASTCSSGTIFIQMSRFNIPISISGTGIFDIENSWMGSNITPYSDRAYLTSNAATTSYIFNSNVQSGTQAGLTIAAGATVQVGNCEFGSSAANVLTGAGTLLYGGIIFTGASAGHNVATETAFTVFG